MLSTLTISNKQGNIILHREYLADVPRSKCQEYCSQIISSKKIGDSPIMLHNGVSFMSVMHNDLVLFVTSRRNANCAMALQFLWKFVQMMKNIVGKVVCEKLVIANLCLIYEILDEAMDYGCPQITDSSIIHNLTEKHSYEQLLAQKSMLKYCSCNCGSRPMFNPEFIIYKNNQIFVYAIQEINLIFSNYGKVVKSDVSGNIYIKSLLSGMPECHLGFNDKLSSLLPTDIYMHPCIRSKFPNFQNSIIFAPPDGYFELLSYKISKNINPPFKILPIYDQKEQKLMITVQIKAQYHQGLVAKDVHIFVPCPQDAPHVSAVSLQGQTAFDGQKGAIIWKIQKMYGQSSHLIQCEIQLSSNSINWIQFRPPISMQFRLPMHICSGLGFKFLRVHDKMGYRARKQLKMLTKSGRYEHR